jgi:hypothetical protein
MSLTPGQATVNARVAFILYLNLRTKPHLAISPGQKDGSSTVRREGHLDPGGADPTQPEDCGELQPG